MNLTEIAPSVNTMQKSTLQKSALILQRQSATIQEYQEYLGRIIPELEDLREHGRQEDTEQIQALLSENEKLKEEISMLRGTRNQLQEKQQKLQERLLKIIKEKEEVEEGKRRVVRVCRGVVGGIIAIMIFVILIFIFICNCKNTLP